MSTIYRGYELKTQSNGMVWIFFQGERASDNEWPNEEDALAWVDAERKRKRKLEFE